METFGSRLRKTAEEVAGRLNEAAQTAGERLAEMREIQRLNAQLRALRREKDRCKMVMADLLIRMFDQNTFAEALLRPEYQQIKVLDEQIAAVEAERSQVIARAQSEGQEAPSAMPAEETPAEGTAEPASPRLADDLTAPAEETPPSTTFEE
jgi:hypothetical protein